MMKKTGVFALLYVVGLAVLAACGDPTATAAPAAQAVVPATSQPTTAPAMSQSTTAPAMAESTTALAMSQSTTAPAMAQLTTAPAMSQPTTAPAMNDNKMSNLPVIRNAPDFANTTWLNTPENKPLNVAGLRGKVFAVEFWTFQCINCQNVTPALKDLYATYADKGFTIVSFHDPEFESEKKWENVQAAVAQRDIRYPVAQDNDFATWNKYGVRAWPTLFLVDKQGRIRYEHIGEGAYDEIKANVAALLNEPAPAS